MSVLGRAFAVALWWFWWVVLGACADSAARDAGRGSGAEPGSGAETGRDGGAAPSSKPTAPAKAVEPADPDLGLSLPEGGFMLHSRGAQIEPGDEREYCEVAQIPGDPGAEYYVSLIDLANGDFSHHMGLAVALPGSPAETEARAVGVGNTRECPGPLLGFGEGIEILGTTQVPRGRASLPKGVARRFHGGQYVIFNYHYYNPTEAPIAARSVAAFHVVDGGDVEHLARLFSLNNVTIDVPPGESASFTGECHFKTDLVLGGLTRHTHSSGTDFTVWYSGGERDGEEIWSSHDWEHDTEYELPEPMVMRAGEGLRYRCTYENDSMRRIRFGTTVEDEMCMLYGPVWPAAEGVELDLPDCNIVWIDDQGIGHSATEAGGFPEPSEWQVAACRGALRASMDECVACQCDHCAQVGLACFQDPDCAELFKCLSGCTEAACTEACHPVVQEHSAGQGLLTALLECAQAECSECEAAL